MSVTLPSLLAARDARRERQSLLLREYPEYALIVLTVNIPGAVKRTEASVGTGRSGAEALRGALGSLIRNEEVHDLETGYEAFFVADIGREEAKRMAVEIEETHPLGRIMDIDVIGEGCVPLSRKEFGLPERSCMICGEQARVCMRAGRHTLGQLLDFINGKWNDYLRRT